VFQLKVIHLSTHCFLVLQLKSFNGCVPDGDYKEWFSSSSLQNNMCDFIKEVQVPVPQDVNEQEVIFPSNIDFNTSLEEMFQMAPSTVISKSLCVLHMDYDFLKTLIQNIVT